MASAPSWTALLDKGRATDALALAELAAQSAPRSVAVATTLGECHAALGHRIEAMQAFANAIAWSDTPRAYPSLTARIRELSQWEPKP